MLSKANGASRDAPATMRAGQPVLAAERIRAEAAVNRGDPLAPLDRKRALEVEGRARTKNLPSHLTETGAGGELIHRDGFATYVSTVDNPDYVTVDASRGRLELAEGAGALEMALDAADTIEARDSLEKMLVHQMAAIHTASMKMAARMNEQLNRMRGMIASGPMQAANVEACRLAGAMARLTAAYQQGVLTLQRKRSNGRQHVIVSHVHQQVEIKDGGQAVVAGRIERTKKAGAALGQSGEGKA